MTVRPSPSGASATCDHCGTIYDTSSSYDLDAVPQVGDGCDECDPDTTDG